MITIHVNDSQPREIPDLEVIRQELENTRTTFHQVVNATSSQQWRQKSRNTDWSVGEIFFHLTWALEYLPKEIALARQGKGMFNMPKWLQDPLSYWYMRLSARKITPDQILQRYDRAMDATLKALETIPESEWKLGAKFYGEGFYTIEELFHTPAEHLTEHTGAM